jgi:hypothetical protein
MVTTGPPRQGQHVDLRLAGRVAQKEGREALNGVLDSLPATLTEHPRIVLWRRHKRGGIVTKPPLTRQNRPASTTDARTWCDYPTALDVLRRNPGLFDGVGIVLGDLGDGWHLAGIDLDSCLDAVGRLAAWAEPFVTLLDTYGEISPSELGIKLFFRIPTTDLPAWRARLSILATQAGCKRSIGANGANHGPAVAGATGDSVAIKPGKRPRQHGIPRGRVLPGRRQPRAAGPAASSPWAGSGYGRALGRRHRRAERYLRVSLRSV